MKTGNKVLGIVAIVLGAFAIVTFYVPIFNIVSLIASKHLLHRFRISRMDDGGFLLLAGARRLARKPRHNPALQALEPPIHPYQHHDSLEEIPE